MTKNVPTNLIPAKELANRMLASIDGLRKADGEVSLLFASAIYEAMEHNDSAPLNGIFAAYSEAFPKYSAAIRRMITEKAPITEGDKEKTYSFGGKEYKVEKPFHVRLKQLENGGRLAGKTSYEIFVAVESQNILTFKAANSSNRKNMDQATFEEKARNLIAIANKRGLDTSVLTKTATIAAPAGLLAHVNAMLARVRDNSATFTENEKFFLEAVEKAAAQWLTTSNEKLADIPA